MIAVLSGASPYEAYSDAGYRRTARITIRRTYRYRTAGRSVALGHDLARAPEKAAARLITREHLAAVDGGDAGASAPSSALCLELGEHSVHRDLRALHHLDISSSR